jgi:predicted TPR repeat methyltransferase
MPPQNSHSPPKKQQALACLQAGRLQEAQQLCDELCRVDTQDAEVWLMLAAIHLQQGAFAAAVECGERALALQPGNPEIYNLLGYAWQQQRELDKAYSRYREALRLRPDYSEALNNLGNTCMELGRPEEAQQCYEEALRIDPNFALACYNLARTLEKQDRPDETIAAYRRTIRLAPEFAEAHNSLGYALERQGHGEAAAVSYREALRLNPRLVEAHNNLGNVFLNQGRVEEATRSYRRALEFNPSFALAYYNLGNALNQQGKGNEAAESFRQAVRLAPDFPEAHHSLGAVLLAQGKGDEAMHCYQEELRIKPGSESARYFIASLGGAPMPAQPPKDYVEALFDGYANRFDQHLITSLGYRAPEFINQILREVLGPDPVELDVLDIGCGTGLCGPLLRDLARTLTGIDLSSRMIDKAREKKVYDELRVGDITSAFHSDKRVFDLIIAADVFPYIGELQGVFTTCFAALHPGGLFVFSVEAAAGDTYVLQSTARYAHSENYVLSLANAVGFAVLRQERVVLRRDKGAAINGYIFVMRRGL